MSFETDRIWQHPVWWTDVITLMLKLRIAHDSLERFFSFIDSTPSSACLIVQTFHVSQFEHSANFWVPNRRVIFDDIVQEEKRMSCKTRACQITGQTIFCFQSWSKLSTIKLSVPSVWRVWTIGSQSCPLMTVEEILCFGMVCITLADSGLQNIPGVCKFEISHVLPNSRIGGA